MSAADSGFYRVFDFVDRPREQPRVIVRIIELPPLPKQKERMDERGNGFGKCRSCKKFKKVWSHICGLCG